MSDKIASEILKIARKILKRKIKAMTGKWLPEPPVSPDDVVPKNVTITVLGQMTDEMKVLYFLFVLYDGIARRESARAQHESDIDYARGLRKWSEIYAVVAQIASQLLGCKIMAHFKLKRGLVFWFMTGWRVASSPCPRCPDIQDCLAMFDPRNNPGIFT